MIRFFEKVKIVQNNPINGFDPLNKLGINLDRNIHIWELIKIINEMKTLDVEVIYKMLSTLLPHERLLLLKRLSWLQYMQIHNDKYIKRYFIPAVISTIIKSDNYKLLENVRNGQDENYNLINITNYLSMNYNFTMQIFNKHLNKLKENIIFNELITKYHIIIGNTFIEQTCNIKNVLKKLIVDKRIVDIYIIDPTDNNMTLAFDERYNVLHQNKICRIELDEFIFLINKNLYFSPQHAIFENGLYLSFDCKNNTFNCDPFFYIYQRNKGKQDLVIRQEEKESNDKKLILTRVQRHVIDLKRKIIKCYQCKKIFRELVIIFLMNISVCV